MLERDDIASVLFRRPETGVDAAHEVGPSRSPKNAGRVFAAEWARAATAADTAALQSVFPRIPRHLDVELLRFAESYVGRSLRGDDEAHHAMRAGFWTTIQVTGPG